MALLDDTQDAVGRGEVEQGRKAIDDDDISLLAAALVPMSGGCSRRRWSWS